MISIQINDVKNFMKKLLLSDTFDQFDMQHGLVTTYNTFEVDGLINKAFFGDEIESTPLYGHTHTPWSTMREYFYSVIKGKHTPLSFKFILYIEGDQVNEIISGASMDAQSNTQALVLNIRYDDHGLILTTGIATHTFLLDKSAEEIWDKWVSLFLGQNALD